MCKSWTLTINDLGLGFNFYEIDPWSRWLQKNDFFLTISLQNNKSINCAEQKVVLFPVKYAFCNESKTEICVFHKSKPETVHLLLNGYTLRSKSNMNVLAVIFDSKMQLQDQVAHTISKSNSTL